MKELLSQKRVKSESVRDVANKFSLSSHVWRITCSQSCLSTSVSSSSGTKVAGPKEEHIFIWMDDPSKRCLRGCLFNSHRLSLGERSLATIGGRNRTRTLPKVSVDASDTKRATAATVLGQAGHPFTTMSNSWSDTRYAVQHVPNPVILCKHSQSHVSALINVWIEIVSASRLRARAFKSVSLSFWNAVRESGSQVKIRVSDFWSLL